MKVYTFHYFALRHLHDSDDKADLKSRKVKAENVEEAHRKFNSYGKHGDLTRDVYEVEEDGKTIWTSSS